ncbi:MAG: hypothetical protein ACXV2H_14975 [Actinomycetes bacterium]
MAASEETSVLPTKVGSSSGVEAAAGAALPHTGGSALVSRTVTALALLVGGLSLLVLSRRGRPARRH